MNYAVIARFKDGTVAVRGPLGRFDAFWTQKHAIEHDEIPFSTYPRKTGLLTVSVVRILSTVTKL